MALTPGGGRSPSTQPPPTSPPASSPRPTPSPRSPGKPQAGMPSIVRWGVLIGGLVIIADLATQAVAQRSLNADDVAAAYMFDVIINCALYSVLGVIVARETARAYSSALAGLVASLLDAVVVAAAAVMAQPATSAEIIEQDFLRNLVVGTLFAGVSGLLYTTVQRLSGGRRPK